MMTFVTLLMLVFGVVGSVKGWRELQLARNSTVWPSTPGEVVASAVEQESHDGSRSYRAAISYRYRVDGTLYSSDQVSFGYIFTLSWDTVRPARDRSAGYPVGRVVEVFYNPAAPQIAALEPGINSGTWQGLLLPIGLLVLGLLGVLGWH